IPQPHRRVLATSLSSSNRCILGCRPRDAKRGPLMEPAMSDLTVRSAKLMATHPIRRLWLTSSTFLISDLFALGTGAIVTVLARWAFHGNYEPYDYLRFTPALALFILIFSLMGLYPGIALNPVEEMRRALYAISTGHLVILTITYLFKSAEMY